MTRPFPTRRSSDLVLNTRDEGKGVVACCHEEVGDLASTVKVLPRDAPCTGFPCRAIEHDDWGARLPAFLCKTRRQDCRRHDQHVDIVLEHLLDRRIDFAGDVGREQKDAIVDRMKLGRSEEHTSELQSLMRISYAVFCLNKKHIKTD